MVIQHERETSRPQTPKWVAATVSVAAVAVALAAMGVLSGGDAASPTPTAAAAPRAADTTAAVTTAPMPAPVTAAIPLSRSVPLLVLTKHRGNAGEVAVIDLESRTRTLYPAGSHGVTDNAFGTTAAVTPDRSWVVVTGPVARLYSGSLATPDLTMSVDPLRAGRGATSAVPTPDGARLWIVEAAGTTGSDPAMVDLVAVGSDDPVLSVAVPQVAPIAAVSTGLVFNGAEGSVQVLDRHGDVTEVAAGTGIAAGDLHVMLLGPCPVPAGCSDRPLQVVGLDGSGPATIEPPGDGAAWHAVGGPSGPGEALSPDGSRFPVGRAVARPQGEPSVSTLLVVDIAERSARPVVTVKGSLPTVAWSADGQWIALFRERQIELIAADAPGRRALLPSVVPRDHEIIAAG